MAIAASAAIVGACGDRPRPSTRPFTGKEATVTAVNIAYDPVEVSLPTGVPLRLVLDNRDNGVPARHQGLQGDQSSARARS